MKIQPLADRIRPSKIEEVIGQKHLLGENKPIYRMVKNKQLSSMIFFGPAGIGKTTIARAIANSVDIPFVALNGVTDGKKEIDTVIKNAEKEDRTYLLYIDEIHRLTKTQSEPLLPAIENGTIVLVSSTTESVYHSLPSGILSRCTVYELFPLSTSDIQEGLERALSDKEKGLGDFNVSLDEGVLEHIAGSTGGDMRSALNALEVLLITNADKGSATPTVITIDMVEEATNKKNLGYNGENTRYDLMSAFQKSLRGSDVNAGWYYLGMLLESGDLVSVCRRLSIIAFEDVGLAQPSVWSAVMAAVDCAEKVGLPEARIPLGDAVALICLSPKSNSAHVGFDSAIADIRAGKVYPIPSYLQDAHYAGAAKLGRGMGYQYPHSFPRTNFGGWVNQEYLPEELVGTEYYKPIEAGAEKLNAQVYEMFKKVKQNEK